MTLAVGRSRKARKQTNERTNTRTNILFTMYSLIFFNVQGGACQFLIDNDKVDHYI